MTSADSRIRESPQGSPRKDGSETLVEIDHAAEKKLIRKLDWHIIPIVMLLYLFSFLDRHVSHSLICCLNLITYYKGEYRQRPTIWNRKGPWFERKSIPDGSVSTLCDIHLVRAS